LNKLIIPIILLVFSFIPVAFADHQSMTTDKDVYYLGQPIHITGYSEYSQYGIYLTIYDADDSAIRTYHIAQNEDGTFNHTFNFSVNFAFNILPGEKTIRFDAKHGVDFSLTTFQYITTLDPLENDIITVDKMEYYLGDTIHITGYLDTASEGDIGTFTIFPIVNGVTQRDGVYDNNGEFHYNVVFDETVESGEMKIRNLSNVVTLFILFQYYNYTNIIFEPDEIPETPEPEEPIKKSSSGCVDCIPPTLGLNTNFKRIVDDGFAYNGNPIQVKKWHTPYPLINSTIGDINKVEIKVYENNGITNMKLVQFGLGVKEMGQPLSTIEVLIEAHLLSTSADGVSVKEIVIIDPDNLIDNDTVSIVAYPHTCQNTDVQQNCIKVDLEYSYRESTINSMMVINVVDKKNNSQNFYFNDGIQVIGESLNEPPTYLLYNKKTKQQQDNLFLTLTRTDKVNHIWEDNYGIEYLKSNDTFERITLPDSWYCDDPIKQVMTRNNCHFREMTLLWK